MALSMDNGMMAVTTSAAAVEKTAVPKIRVDIAQRETDECEWKGHEQQEMPAEAVPLPLSTRGLDALQAIREAAEDRLSLQQSLDSPEILSLPSERSNCADGTSAVRRTRGKSVAAPETEAKKQKAFDASMIPPRPQIVAGLPARSFRFLKKEPEPPIPMYVTSPEKRYATVC